VATQEALTYNLYHELYWFLWDEALDANSGWTNDLSYSFAQVFVVTNERFLNVCVYDVFQMVESARRRVASEIISINPTGACADAGKGVVICGGISGKRFLREDFMEDCQN
jgi:hypothetical protein